MNILVVKLSAIGDVIHTLPAVLALRRRYPKAHLTWVVETAASDLVLGHPAVDRVLVSRRKEWIAAFRNGPDRMTAFREAAAFVARLRDRRYDLVIDFQQLLKSAMIVVLAGGRVRTGFDRGMEHMEESHLALNRRIPPVSMEIHALRRYLLLVETLGTPPDEVEYGLPVDPVAEAAVGRLLSAERVGDGRPLVAVNPMAQWPTKLWDEDRFGQAADEIRDRFGVHVVFTGGPGDRAVTGRIRSRMRGPSADLTGRTRLRELAALYRRCACLVTTDTGPMHLAAAVGTPVAALFGPTAPWRTGPFGEGHHVLRGEAPCAPCFKRSCRRGDRKCMSDISVERVVMAVGDLLE